MKKKGILISLTLAIFLTVGSASLNYYEKGIPNPFVASGFPFRWHKLAACPEACVPRARFNYLLADLLFWFGVVFILWKLLKWGKGEYGKYQTK